MMLSLSSWQKSLPHLNVHTAHKHVLLVGKEHYEASECVGWWVLGLCTCAHGELHARQLRRPQAEGVLVRAWWQQWRGGAWRGVAFYRCRAIYLTHTQIHNQTHNKHITNTQQTHTISSIPPNSRTQVKKPHCL